MEYFTVDVLRSRFYGGHYQNDIEELFVEIFVRRLSK